MRIYEIIPGKLYQSAEFIDVPITDKLSILKEQGIDAVVNMYSHRDTILEKHLYEYIFCPIPDGQSWDPLVVMDVVDKIIDIIASGHRVLVHCHGGRNRSGLVNSIVVMELSHCSGKEALALVREKRPNAVATPSFESFLEGL